MDVENYVVRETEVAESGDRYADIFVPDVEPALHTMFKLTRGDETFYGRVARLLGSHMVTLDFLHSAPNVGAISVQQLPWEAAIEPGDRASETRFSEGGVAWLKTRAEHAAPFPVADDVDACAPFQLGGVNVAFVPQPMMPTFIESDGVCVAGEFNDSACGWDVFARYAAGVSFIIEPFTNDLEHRIDQFCEVADGTLFFVIHADEAVFPIVESFRFASVDTTWVVTESGEIDLLRSRSSMETQDGPAKRGVWASEREAHEFSVMIGENEGIYTEHLSRPLFA